jgi:hypothetical protein
LNDYQYITKTLTADENPPVLPLDFHPAGTNGELLII